MLDEKILALLKKVIYPNFEKDIVAFGFVKEARYENGDVVVVVRIPSSVPETAQALEREIKNALGALGAAQYHITIEQPTPPQEAKPQTKNIAPNIKNFVMISSGKGGVGKSTTSVNLAIALAQQGRKVGLLDADIYGPNIPRMLGLNAQHPEVDQTQKRLIPLVAFGVEMMSIGVLYPEGQSLIWRGPMIMRAIDQMLTDVAWGELDVLVVDLPPGTGDAQLTFAQSVPVTAGITVTTPQRVSLDDSVRSLDMFQKLKIPIAGIIENMSGFICPDNGKEYDIFGKGTAEAVAEQFGTQLLAQIPIEISIREGSDSGKPIVFFAPESKSAQNYRAAAEKLWSFIEQARETADNSAIQPTKT